MSKSIDHSLLKEELERDEGVIYKIYRDHLGFKTLGVGHLIRPSDPEYNLPVGTPIDKEIVEQYLYRDMISAVLDTRKLFPNFEQLPREAKHVLINMMFNLGYTKFSKFKNFRKAIDRQDWEQAAHEMEDSLWYRQVGGRSIRLKKQILNLQ